MKDTPNVIARPPLIYLVFILGGILLQKIIPTQIIPNDMHYFGYVLIVLGVSIVGISIKQFNKAGTTFKVEKPSTSIVKTGLYRFSRNPIYIGLSLIYLGVGIAANNIWIVILLIPILIIVHYGVILREEQYLEKKFAKEYLTYKSRVRRWI
jgi:protein-S-isoprenylcysteine O-methyltransferase Ste14